METDFSRIAALLELKIEVHTPLRAQLLVKHVAPRVRQSSQFLLLLPFCQHLGSDLLRVIGQFQGQPRRQARDHMHGCPLPTKKHRGINKESLFSPPFFPSFFYLLHEQMIPTGLRFRRPPRGFRRMSEARHHIVVELWTSGGPSTHQLRGIGRLVTTGLYALSHLCIRGRNKFCKNWASWSGTVYFFGFATSLIFLARVS